MCSERRLLLEELDAFNSIGVKEMCVIIVAKVVWIGQMLVAQFAAFLKVDAHCVGHFVQRFEFSVE
jgi:hypothetical protein